MDSASKRFQTEVLNSKNQRTWPILIDCSQLSNFKTKSTSNGLVFDFSPQTSISHLYVNEFRMENFGNLKNLAYLSVIDFKYKFKSNKYTEEILESFPELNTISIRTKSFAGQNSTAFKELLERKTSTGKSWACPDLLWRPDWKWGTIFKFSDLWPRTH